MVFIYRRSQKSIPFFPICICVLAVSIGNKLSDCCHRLWLCSCKLQIITNQDILCDVITIESLWRDVFYCIAFSFECMSHWSGCQYIAFDVLNKNEDILKAYSSCFDHNECTLQLYYLAYVFAFTSASEYLIKTKSISCDPLTL